MTRGIDKTVIVALAYFGVAALGEAQTRYHEDAHPDTLPPGISYQSGPGSNNGNWEWTYPYGTKLTVNHHSLRNFEIGTTTYPYGQLVFRQWDYSENPEAWGAWRTILAEDEVGRIGVGTAAPQAKLEVNGQFRVTGLGPIPTSGRGIEMYWSESGSIGDIFAYNRDTNAMMPLRLRGSKILLESGNVGIGTINPANKLDVNGTIRAKEVIVETNWPDYVFEEDYQLRSLREVEAHITEHGHLPGVPSAEDVAVGGVSLGDSQRILLEKIEELTLYAIEKEKEVSDLKERLDTKEDVMTSLASRLERIEQLLQQPTNSF